MRLLAVRALIGAALRPVDVAELQQWREEDTVPGGPVLDPDLRWKLLQRLCVLGAAGEPEIAEEVVRDPSSTGAEGAARCRAALPDESAKTAAWHQLFHGEASNYLVMALAQGFWQPEQADLLAPWTLRYFDDVPAAAERRGPAVARRLGHQGFPAYAATEEVLLAAEACLGRDDLTAALRRHLADQVDDLRRALRAREASK